MAGESIMAISHGKRHTGPMTCYNTPHLLGGRRWLSFPHHADWSDNRNACQRQKGIGYELLCIQNDGARWNCWSHLKMRLHAVNELQSNSEFVHIYFVHLYFLSIHICIYQNIQIYLHINWSNMYTFIQYKYIYIRISLPGSTRNYLFFVFPENRLNTGMLDMEI
jgi:hypothetical protein